MAAIVALSAEIAFPSSGGVSRFSMSRLRIDVVVGVAPTLRTNDFLGRGERECTISVVTSRASNSWRRKSRASAREEELYECPAWE